MDDELHAEMEQHIEMLAGRFASQGMPEAEARRAARQRFGNPRALREASTEAWEFPVIESLLQDLRFGWRLLRRAPGFAVVAVLTLSIGIGANTAVFSLVNAWLLRPLPLKDPQRLISVWRTAPASPHEPAYFDLYHDYLVWAASNHTLQSLAATFPQDYTLTGAGEPQQLHGAVASWNLFATVGAQAALGRLFVEDDTRGEPACVISESLWKKQFGGSLDAIGRTVKLNDKAYLLLGVLPAKFSLRVLDRPFDTDVWTLIGPNDPGHTASSPAPVSVIGRLKDGTTVSQAEADLNAIQRDLNHRFADEPRDSGVMVAGLQQDNTRTIRMSLLLLSGAVAVLLLIACVNAGSLILGRNSHRATEFAVRVALGCSSRRLLQQLSIEVLLLFVCGGALGLGLAFALVRLFVVSNPLGVLPAGGISLDAIVLGASAGMTFMAALIFGSAPAVRALRGIDAEVLASRAMTSGRAHLRSRMAFVATEMALSVVLLVSAGLLITSFAHLATAPLGFRIQEVYVGDVALPMSRYPDAGAQGRFVDQLLARVRALPSVQAAGATTTWPFQANGLGPIEIAGRPGEQDRINAFAFTAGSGYFEAMGIRLFKGRTFNDDDRAGKPDVVVINEEMARRYFAGEDPVGKRIRLGSLSRNQPNDEPWRTIVGVVASTRSQRYNHTDWDLEPAVYISMLQRGDVTQALRRFDAQHIYFYVQAQSIDTRTFASAVHEIDPELPVERLRSTGAIVSELRAQPRLRATALGGFASLTLLLAVVGVYGVMTQFVEQRRREIGIRVALGATRPNVVALIFRRMLVLVASGVAIGIAGAVAAARLLRGLLFGVSAFDPRIFAGVVLTLVAAAIVASYLPARRAASVDPASALRYE